MTFEDTYKKFRPFIETTYRTNGERITSIKNNNVPAEYVADNYAWESAIWFFAYFKKKLFEDAMSSNPQPGLQRTRAFTKLVYGGYKSSEFRYQYYLELSYIMSSEGTQ